MMDEDTSDSQEHDCSPNEAANFFVLPQEIRDIIYAQFPYLASIHINQDASRGLLQPNISMVCRRMRKESLDVFYGRNKFFLDLRGWKGSDYPRKWTPRDIFERWITAVGDENAARLRSLSFFSYNFRANLKVSHDTPPTLTLRFRTNGTKAEVAEGVPSSYTFEAASRRADKALRCLLADLQKNVQQRPLNVEDLKALTRAVDGIQPFLCRRMNLGYQGATILEDDLSIDQWPDTKEHLERCDDCGYHRFT